MPSSRSKRNNQEKIVKEFIDSIYNLKFALTELSKCQKDISLKINDSFDDINKVLASITTELRMIRDTLSNIQLKYMLSSKDIFLKKEYENSKKNGNGSNHNNNSKKSLKELLDKEEEIDKELMYRYIGKLITKNFKFLVIILVLAIVGALIIFGGPSWIKWFMQIPH